MTRTVSLVAATVILLGISGPAHAQIKVVKKPAPQAGSDEVVVYTWTSSWGLRDDPPDKYPLGIATHKTEAEAVAAAKAHIARTAGNGNLAVTHYLIEGEPSVPNKTVVRAQDAKELLDRVKEAKEAVDKAKKVAKGEEPLLKASERKLGDTIKEYKDMVAKSFAQVTEAKKTLTSGVASLTDAKFRQVNGLIDQYNREVNDFRSVMGKDADLGFSPMARVEPPKAEVSSLEGKKGTGKLGVIQGGTKFFVEFKSGGIAEMGTAEEGSTFTGTWTQSGNTITMKAGASTFSGTLEGNRISGTRSRKNAKTLKDTVDTWELTLEK